MRAGIGSASKCSWSASGASTRSAQVGTTIEAGNDRNAFFPRWRGQGARDVPTQLTPMGDMGQQPIELRPRNAPKSTSIAGGTVGCPDVRIEWRLSPRNLLQLTKYGTTLLSGSTVPGLEKRGARRSTTVIGTVTEGASSGGNRFAIGQATERFPACRLRDYAITKR